MLFVFEHRATELREYGHHITQLFTSLDVPHQEIEEELTILDTVLPDI